MYEFDLLEVKNFKIVKTGIKNVYNTDNTQPASEWVRVPIKKIKTFDYPQMKSALNINSTGQGCRGNMIKDGLGFFYNNSNNIDKNSNNVGLFSSCFTSGSGCSIGEKNFQRVVTLFSARRTIFKNWINSKDEYISPNVDNENFIEFMHDSVVYSLFNSVSNQSSLRQISYKEQLWDIKNQFFWMSKNEMVELSNQNNYTELYYDARTDSDRYVYTILSGEEGIYNQLSDEAKDVLDSATNLVRLSFGMRRNFADDTNQLNSWDAGYAQLKLLWKEYYPEQFKEFRDKYKVLEDKMRPMVYELGFLLK
jgi:hypothetical protein